MTTVNPTYTMLSINTCQNDKTTFQAKPKTVLTKEIVNTMPAVDILELSTATLKNQDIDIIRMVRAKINNFIQVLNSKYCYIKANAIEFSANEISKTKSNKRKAQKIEKLLTEKIREEKVKKGAELNSDTNDIIPIEYLILPEEEKIHSKMIKMDDLIVDKNDADKYKYQRAKHDRNLSRTAITGILKILKERKNIKEKHQLDAFDINRDYETKKMYNNFAEKILFAESKVELDKLQEKICITEIDEWLKEDLLELIKRKITLCHTAKSNK